tara:strand:- start:40 stop:186 length:147 start_codon:yes stop_codon:yes gene_type:complete
MKFFDEFEIIGGIIPNLIGLAGFCGVIIYFDQTRKSKVIRGEKVTPHQ